MRKRTRKERSAEPCPGIIWAVGDGAVIWIAFLVAHWVRYHSGVFPGDVHLGRMHFSVLAAIALSWIILFALGGLYRRELLERGLDQLFALSRCVSLGVLLLLFASFVTKTAYFLEGRMVLLLAWGLSLAGLGLYRMGGVRPLQAKMEGVRARPSRVLVVGAGESGRDLVTRLRADEEAHKEPIGFLDDDPVKIGTLVDGLPVLASTSMVELIAGEEQPDEIFIAIGSLPHEETIDLASRCMRSGVPVKMVSDSFRLFTSTAEIELVGGVPTVHYREGNLSGLGLALKRATDVVVASTLVVLFFPLLGLIALLIRVTSGAPTIFRQMRAGQHGRPFCLWKFRTMRDEGDDLHRRYATALITGEDLALRDGRSRLEVFKPPEDPRVTPIGRILRKASLDELPQLINVIKGEMSLVGPRPPILYELNHYKEWHRRRLTVKPGVTGLWQVYGRSRVPFDQMVTLDLYYIDHWSLLNDLKLLLRTIPVVLSGKGAY